MGRASKLLVVAVASAGIGPALPCAALAQGLIAAYGLEEGTGSSVSDHSGSGNTGTLSGAAWTTQGRFGNALAFNGTDELVTVIDSPSLDLVNAMTLEAWVYPTAASSGWQDVVFKATDIYYLEARSPAGTPAAGGTFAGNPLHGSSPVPIAKWTHLAATYDRTTLRLYVDGIEVASRAETAPVASSSQPLFLGGDTAFGQHFAGRIDEVRIYDRALSPAEIQGDMNSPVVPGTPPASPGELGQWSEPVDWPLVAVHVTLLRTGRVLIWDDHTDDQGAQLYDPATGQLTPVPFDAENLFCSGHSVLSDGRVFVTGGHIAAYVGIPNSSFFEPDTTAWSPGPLMSYPRWYPTNTTLPDGRVLVTSGAIDCITCLADVPEVYDPVTNSWTELESAVFTINMYPHLFVLPDGRVFASSTQEEPIASAVLDVEAETWTTVDPAVLDGGSAVSYLPGRIMKSGTGWNPDLPVVSAAPTTYVIDMTQPSPLWRQTASMAFARTQHNLTLLPDGTVLVTGGAGNSDVNDVSAAVYVAELWNPTTEAWKTLDTAHRPRMYHSTALLLPDARVLVAGGGRFGVDELSAEIYSPPYLFAGPRPAITAAPTTPIGYAGSFFVQTPDAARIGSVSLIRPGSVTHAFNAEQRFLSLAFQVVSGGLSVSAPANANLAPAGSYLLFLVDTNGVPSVGAFVSLSPAVPVPALSALGLAIAGTGVLAAGLAALHRRRSGRRRPRGSTA